MSISLQLGNLVNMVGGWPTPAIVVIGAFAGGFVNGLTGFGTALTGLPIWLHGVPPPLAAQLASACSVLGHVSTFPALRHSVDWRRLAPLIGAGLAGVPVGTFLLPLVSPGVFKGFIGLVLIAYCSFMLLGGSRLRLGDGSAAGSRGAEAAIGFGAGILGGLAALSGVLPTVWASLKAWPKDQRRVFFQAFNFAVLTAMLATSALLGQIGPASLLAMGVAAPGTLIGASLGLRLYRRLDDRRFDRLVLGVLLLSGIALTWSSL